MTGSETPGAAESLNNKFEVFLKIIVYRVNILNLFFKTDFRKFRFFL